MVPHKNYKVARVVKGGPIQTRILARRNFRILANRGTRDRALHLDNDCARHPMSSLPDLLYGCRELSRTAGG